LRNLIKIMENSWNFQRAFFYILESSWNFRQLILEQTHWNRLKFATRSVQSPLCINYYIKLHNKSSNKTESIARKLKTEKLSAREKLCVYFFFHFARKKKNFPLFRFFPWFFIIDFSFCQSKNTNFLYEIIFFLWNIIITQKKFLSCLVLIVTSHNTVENSFVSEFF
jgi:hypothetical protein